MFGYTARPFLCQAKSKLYWQNLCLMYFRCCSSVKESGEWGTGNGKWSLKEKALGVFFPPVCSLFPVPYSLFPVLSYMLARILRRFTEMRSLLFAAAMFLAACQPGANRVEPNKGSVEGGDTVSIKGGPFGKGIRVEFGKIAAETVTVLSSEELTVKVPRGEAPGTVDVVITDDHGKQTTITKGYEYQPRKEAPVGTGGK
jgi:hypothetical protein